MSSLNFNLSFTLVTGIGYVDAGEITFIFHAVITKSNP